MAVLPFRPAQFGRQLDELGRWREALDAKGPLVRSWEGQLRRDLEAEAVAASTSMEGVPVTALEVRRILGGEQPRSVATSDAELVRGYRDAMGYVQRRADDPDFEWSAELLKAIHDRVMAGRFDRAGRFAKGRFIVNDVTGELVFTPPQDQRQLRRLVPSVCERMNSWDGHAALKAAWVHVAVAAVHPFKDGNGRTARILASLTMYRGGFRRPEFCSLEEWWGRHRPDYYAAFRCLGAEFSVAADVTSFVAAHLAAQLSQVRALDMRERTTRGIWTALEAACADAGLPARASIALWEVFNGRDVTAPYYAAVADVSRPATTVDLRAMRAAGLVSPVGQTRGRKYIAGSRLFATVARQLGAAERDADRETIVAELVRRAAVSPPRVSVPR